MKKKALVAIWALGWLLALAGGAAAQATYTAEFGWDQTYTDICDHDNFYWSTADGSQADIENAGLDCNHLHNGFQIGPEYAISVTTAYTDPVEGPKETGHSNIVWISKAFQPGDANHDGVINSSDISFTLINRDKPITPLNIGCDVWPVGAPDNKIDNYDVIQVRAYVAAAG